MFRMRIICYCLYFTVILLDLQCFRTYDEYLGLRIGHYS